MTGEGKEPPGRVEGGGFHFLPFIQQEFVLLSPELHSGGQSWKSYQKRNTKRVDMEGIVERARTWRWVLDSGELFCV